MKGLHGQTAVKTVLIVDNDPGFMLWLGWALHEAGWEGLPAKCVNDAFVLLQNPNIRVDVLIVNFTLERAAELVEALRSKNPQLKVIALLSDSGPQPEGTPRADASVQKPGRTGEPTDIEWLREFRRLLSREPGDPKSESTQLFVSNGKVYGARN